jgi:predicted amidohydrolase YtcJ
MKILSIMLLFAVSSIADVGASGAADTAYVNGRIYTVNEAQPWATAVAIKDGKFIAIGSEADIDAVTGNDTNVVDLEGQFVMPGIFDLHAHPFITPWYGSMNLQLQNPGDAEAILADIKAYADENPDKEWIIGG